MKYTDKTNSSHFIPKFRGLFGDKRLENRGESLIRMLTLQPCSSIRRISGNRAEQKAYYRFLHHESVREESLVREAASRVSNLVEGRHVLCIQDTSEINLVKHRGRLERDTGLGRSDNADSDSCFKIHPGFVIDAANNNPLGFSHIKIWHRPDEMPDRFARRYKSLPIEDKESYKWIEVAQVSKEVLQSAKMVTFVEDREGDIYEQFANIPNEKTHLIVRSRTSRKLSGGGDLQEQVSAMPVSGSYTIELAADHRKNRQHRKATIQVRFCKCSIRRPANCNKSYKDTLEVYVVEAKEIGGKSQSDIHWRLITTHPVNGFESALQIIHWYSARWFIEQLFRLLKRQGFGIENSEIESGWAIRKLAVLQLMAILKIMQMNIAYNDPEEGQPIEEVFCPQEIDALVMLNKKLQGKTTKQQNHYNPRKTKWATWVVARLGGWKGYNSQGPPGVLVLKRGLERLTYVMEGLTLKKDVGTR